MAQRDAAFTGSIPELDDRYLGPMLFARHARPTLQPSLESFVFAAR